MMLLTFCLGSLLLLVEADTSVHILSKFHGQLVTSSILNWIPDAHYSASKDFVIGGFEIVETEDPSESMKRPIFVCRALHNGIWVAGEQKEGDKRCTVTLTGSVQSYERYQLLENVERAARVTWTDWTKYYQPPVGAVATDKLYVARHVSTESTEDGRKPSQTHYVGTLNSQDSLGVITYVKEDGQEGSAESGQLLVETEPISYELTAVKLNHMKRRVVKRSPRILGEATISNTGSSPAKMAEAFGYAYLYTLYWGQGHAMLKGLNTSVTLQNKTRLPDMNWGIDIRENRTGVYTVEVDLEPGTAVNVTLRGDYTDVEVPYSGKLFSHYEDGASTNPRTIGGVRREESISDVAPELGPVYYLSNFSLVPTTPQPPSTEPASTTASTTPATTTRLTTAPTTTNQQQQQQQQQGQQFELSDSATEQQYSKENAAVDENAIVSPGKQPEATGMQGDDGGPLSLKDKAEGGQSAAAGPQASTLLALATAALAVAVVSRVT